MSKVLVIYWSGTGNTQAMAKAVAEGAGDATLVTAGDARAEMVNDYTSIAFGCPSMGDEVLEEGEMEPLFTQAEALLSGKHIALFGSYGWGDGQWMRDWQERVTAAGGKLVGGEGLIVNEAPSDDHLEQCRELGRSLAAL